MKRLTFNAFIIIGVVCAISVIAVVASNILRTRAFFDERNEICYNFGLDLSSYMGDNQTHSVTGCECYFLPVAYRDTATECVCDCLVPGIAPSACHTVRGCSERNNSCYCSFGIFIT